MPLSSAFGKAADLVTWEYILMDQITQGAWLDNLPWNTCGHRSSLVGKSTDSPILPTESSKFNCCHAEAKRARVESGGDVDMRGMQSLPLALLNSSQLTQKRVSTSSLV